MLITKKPIFVIQVYLVQGYQGLILALVIVLVLPMDGFRCSQKPNTRCVQVLANKQSQTPDALEKNGTIYGYENL